MKRNLRSISGISIISLALCGGWIACKKDKDDSSQDTGLSIYKKLYGATAVRQDGEYVVITSTGIPDHKSPYFKGTSRESSLYEAYNGSNTHWSQNPNKIAAFDYTFRIPLHPAAAATKQATPGGPIGISLNGVPFFNQYAAMGAPLTGEINSFDQYGGHPQQQGAYHYHVEPYYLTASQGKEALLGFLLDGFPVYGPVERGVTISNADLDVYHGHQTATADYPDGIYHYHITDADPYLNGNGFYGTPGTVSQ